MPPRRAAEFGLVTRRPVRHGSGERTCIADRCQRSRIADNAPERRDVADQRCRAAGERLDHRVAAALAMTELDEEIGGPEILHELVMRLEAEQGDALSEHRVRLDTPL